MGEELIQPIENCEAEQKKENENKSDYRSLVYCPFCHSLLVKRGLRKKKYEAVQVYYCSSCEKKITPLITKNKTYPLKVIADSIILYNRLYSCEEITEIIKERYGISISPRIILEWLKEFGRYAPFLRMREFASKHYSRKDIIEESKLIHQQIYNFKYHRAKLDAILNEEFKHFKFKPLREFLELVIAECPHQLFQNSGSRSSEFKSIFDLNELKIVSKQNTAVSIANYVLQAVSNNKLRHEVLQEFMLVNDSTTVAVEVPVILSEEDLRHYNYELRFNVPIKLKDGEHITGHIDFVQIRNGSIYILDFKPSAKKEKPIEQLTIYALALSRLTGIRLYHFKCAWFDEENYYEFFPLHVVYKLNKRKRH